MGVIFVYQTFKEFSFISSVINELIACKKTKFPKFQKNIYYKLITNGFIKINLRNLLRGEGRVCVCVRDRERNLKLSVEPCKYNNYSHILGARLDTVM